jgi:hypothetical protein
LAAISILAVFVLWIDFTYPDVDTDTSKTAHYLLVWLVIAAVSLRCLFLPSIKKTLKAIFSELDKQN